VTLTKEMPMHLVRLIPVLVALVPSLAAANPDVTDTTPPPPPRLRMSVEVDPADYTVYHGWGAFVGIRPAATAPWRFRIGGGSAKLPDMFVQGNGNDDWHQKIDAVVTVAAHRYFGDGRGGFFLGGVAGWSSIQFTAPSGDSVDVSNVTVGIDAGYRWFPSKKLGLVITPHLGAIVPVWKDHEPAVGMEKYKLLPIIPNPQLLIGYEFDVLK
jgi:hypothetical protein